MTRRPRKAASHETGQDNPGKADIEHHQLHFIIPELVDGEPALWKKAGEESVKKYSEKVLCDTGYPPA
jgi:hypothetical protein